MKSRCQHASIGLAWRNYWGTARYSCGPLVAEEKSTHTNGWVVIVTLGHVGAVHGKLAAVIGQQPHPATGTAVIGVVGENPG